jgi:hypothetical protein
MRITNFNEKVGVWLVVPLAATFGAVALCAGCASPGPRGEIPFGRWSGEGTFVYEHWKAEEGETEDKGPQSIHRDYTTTLSIQPTQLDGQDAVELEIHSDRGPLPGLGDETHLKVALSEAKRVSDSVVLYRVVGSLFNPKPDEELHYHQDGPPFGATCTDRDGTTILQLQYEDNFVDTFRFRRDQVEKFGIYGEKNEGFIHWSENLSRRK